jgi:hypothetical protein
MRIAKQYDENQRGMINRKGSTTAYIYDYVDVTNPTAGIQHSEAIACDKKFASLSAEKQLAKVREKYEIPAQKIITGVRLHKGDDCYFAITYEQLIKYGTELTKEEAEAEEAEEKAEAEAEAKES